jgi:hypothetical protein
MTGQRNRPATSKEPRLPFGRRIRADVIREHWDEARRLIASRAPLDRILLSSEGGVVPRGGIEPPTLRFSVVNFDALIIWYIIQLPRMAKS